MIREGLFYLVILLANIMQGITGFAGTILAMPFSLMLVGYDVAKPVLNVLGLLSGIYVFLGNREHVSWKEFRRVAAVMAVGILAGIGVKQLLSGQERLLYLVLGMFVVVIAVQGLYATWRAGHRTGAEGSAGADGNAGTEDKPGAGSFLLLLGAGVAHGMFVSGGPLLISYLTKRLQDKEAFRATISTVWIVLNSMILATDIAGGLWNVGLMRVQLLAVLPLLAGMWIGSKLYRMMSQRVFMVITYLLLFISGVTLLAK